MLKPGPVIVSPKSARGVTLIEIAVALAILGIVTALSVAALGGMRPRMDVSSMSTQFAAAVGEAQARALRNQRDVWLMVYVEGAEAPALNGGYVIYESRSGTFDFPSYSVAGGAEPQVAGDVVALQTWFRPEITSGRVSFAAPTEAFPLVVPFGGLQAEEDCNFCTDVDDGRRGAIVFEPNGDVRFVRGDGTPDTDLGVAIVTLLSDLDSDFARAAIAVNVTGLTRVTKP